MKKILAALALLSHFTLSAQTDSTENDEPWLPADSIAFVTGVQADMNAHSNPCQTRYSVLPTVIRYESVASVYFKLQGDFSNLTSPTTFTVYPANGAAQVASYNYTGSLAPFYIDNLPLNESYEVKTLDACGTEHTISHFNTLDNISTSEDDAETIVKMTCDSKIMQMFGEYLEENPNVFDFYSELIVAPNINYFDKLVFTQEYLLDGIRLPDQYHYSLSDMEVIAVDQIELITNTQFFIDLDFIRNHAQLKTTAGGCNCKIATWIPVSGAWEAGHMTSATTMAPFSDGIIKKQDDNGRRTWYSFSRLFPARYEQMWNDYINKSVPREYEANEMGGSDGTILPKYHAGIAYSYRCFDGFGNINNDCGCVKDVRLAYSYAADVHIKLSDVKGTTKFSNMAKDFSIMSIDNEVDQPIFEYKLIGTDGKFAQTINSGKMFEGVGNIVKAVFKTTKLGKESPATVVDDFVSGINTTINAFKDWKTWEGSNFDKTTGGTAFLGERTIKLHPNKNIMVRILSGSHLYSNGQGRYKATCKTVSYYSLASYMPKYYTPSNENGCNHDGMATWVAGTVVPNGDNNIKHNLSGFYQLNFYYGYNWSMLGMITGANQSLKPSGIDNVTNNAPTVLLFPIQYTVRSIDGKVLGRGIISTEPEYQKTLKWSISDRPTGMYIAYITDAKGQMTTEKIIH